MANVHTLDDSEYAVIDLDTGTVLGTNVCLVSLDGLSEWDYDALCSSDDLALNYAERFGIDLSANV